MGAVGAAALSEEDLQALYGPPENIGPPEMEMDADLQALYEGKGKTRAVVYEGKTNGNVYKFYDGEGTCVVYAGEREHVMRKAKWVSAMTAWQ